MTSAIPKTPINRGTNSIPPNREENPIVNRGLPEMLSIPIVAKLTPKKAMMKDFRLELPLKFERTTNPIMAREKYSGGPKASATSAKGGAKKFRPTTEKVPATKEPIAAMARAAPARPFKAILYPSKQVTTLVASPGTFTKIDVVDPP